jgi:structural maintenance of chromosome 3 (chondroitin sulfate proteoglycan 6)
VLDVMIKEKTGRVTFMPLNRLKPKNPPAPNAQDAIPLLDKLQYDPALQKAFQQVFGKTCVCRDLTIAAAYVKSHGINTITLDGDKVDRKGAMTGGYHDIRRSRIEAIKSVTQWRSKFEAEGKRSREAKAETNRVEQEITRVTGRISALTGQQNQTRDARERLLEEGRTYAREKEQLKERIVKLEVDGEELETELNGLGVRIAGYQAELGSPLMAGLTAEEAEMVETLGKEVDRGRKDLVELGKARNEVRDVQRVGMTVTVHDRDAVGKPEGRD